MQNEAMQKPKSMGPISVLGLCSPLTLLAQAEASFKTQKARLRAQQRGRVAKGKKGRFMAELRHLWSHSYHTWVEEICRPSSRSHYRCEIHRTAPAWESARKGELGGPLCGVPPQEEKG